VASVAGIYLAVSISQANISKQPEKPARPPMPASFDRVIRTHAQELFDEGRDIFRYDTFGNQDFWGGALRLHEAVEGSAHGGVGDGLSPRAALGLGLKVDAEALPMSLVQALQAGKVDLDDPNVTLELLRLNAVVGVTGFTDGAGGLQSIGIQCALCHSTVDNSVAEGIGNRLDGWANRDLDIGAIVALAPNLDPLASLLGVSQDEVRRVLTSWGPGRFDAELVLDGKAFRPDGKTAATLIPPAFGLAGVNLHTWTGWGSVPHWNAFVSNLEMHGKGTFYDPRLDDAERFPIAAENRFGHVTSDPDLITPKLPALHLYQMSIPAPAPPPGSFDEVAASRGQALFRDKARCATCHTDGLFTEPGWNMHRGEEIGIDDFQADRSPDRRYRTSPLRGLWSHAKGGFYHDGRFATLLDVVDHYEGVMALGLSDGEKTDLVEYLKSLGGDVEPVVADAARLNAAGDLTSGGQVTTESWRISVRPSPVVRGVPVRVVLEGIALGGAPTDLETKVYDVQGRLVAELNRFTHEPAHGSAFVTWDGRGDDGKLVAAGVYFVRIASPRSRYEEERKIVLR
jgi:mono/diheme cytochrome c family protein